MAVNQQIQSYTTKRILIIGISLILLFTLILAGMAMGSTRIGGNEIISSLLGGGKQISRQILFNIRLPRLLSAIIAGLALSVSGSVIQTVIRNPLGSPYTLGLSAASAFGAAFAIVIIGAFTPGTSALSGSPYLITLSAFIFGMLCAFLITVFARWKGATPQTLVMAGIILGSLFSSATSLLQYVSSDVELSSVISWMFGDLGKATWEKTIIQTTITLPVLLYFIFNAFNYNSLNAGDEVAASLGVKVNRLRMVSVMLASLCAAVTVAFFGIIAFVGLVVPHITRWIVGYNERFVLVCSAIFGGIFLLLSDIISRTIIAPIVIPVGILTSFIGAPFFIFLLVRNIQKSS